MKINRSFIYFKYSNLRKWLILILSFRLLPIIQSTYLDNQSTDLSTLESVQNDIQNRDHFLNHINQLNSNYDNRFINVENQQFKRRESSSNNEKPIFLKRISLLSNIFGKSDSEEEKKIDKVDNQTESKNSELKKENTTVIDDLNKNLNQSNLDNQFALLKNHLQNDKEIDTLNTIINFNKNYENWQDHFKNHHSFNRQDLINFLNLNNTTNNTNEQVQAKSKNLAIYSPESFTSKSSLYDNNQFGFKPNNFLSSLLVNNNEHDYYSRYNNANNEKMTEASDLNSEYDEDNKDIDDDENKQINNRNGHNNKKRKIIRNRYRQNLQNFKQKNKMRKTFDDQYNRNIQNNGFRPVDKLLKEQSQQISSASTGNLKRNSINKNENNNGKTTKRLNNNSVVNSTSIPSTTTTTTINEQEYNQLSVSNQPFKLKQNIYRLPTNHYGKRLINEILNGHTNIRKNLISSNNNKNVIINTATTNPVTIDNTTDQLEDDNNETGKEEILNEQDKQLVTDKTKELYEKNDELNDLQVNDYETTVNKDIDLKNNDLINPQNQQIDTATQLNQQNQLTNQPEIDSNENDTIENENDLNNSMNSLFKNETNKESDLDTIGKTKFLINELNKSSKQDKFKIKQQNLKKMNLEKVMNSNYKYYKIYDKYSKLNGFNSNFNFDSNYPTNSYLSNENFKINLNGNNGKAELDELTANNLIPYPNIQYNKQNSYNNLYYPLIKKKPYFSNYPSTFSTNPLNSMLFDKLNMPIDTYSPIDKLPPPLPIIKNVDKSPLENNKFYNLDSKLHNLNSKYSLNSLTPPPPPFALPHHLDAKYYEPKGGHYDKYHSIGNWQSGLAGFLLGVVPFSMLMASMVPTISAISSGGAAAAALGRRRRSINNEKSLSHDKNENKTEKFDDITKLNANTDCLLRLSKIIESINTLIKEQNKLKRDKANIYFNQLIDLQKECIFNFSLPVDFYQELRKFLNFKNLKMHKKGRDSYYAYEFGDKTTNLLNSVLSFFINLIINKGTEIFTQSRIDQQSKPEYIGDQYTDYHLLNNDNQFSIFHLREVRCLQEVFCKVILSKNFKKSVFSNLTTVLANVIPEKLAEKYGLDVLQNGLKLNKCVIQKSYC